MLKGLFSVFILLQSGERRGGLPCLRRYAVNILRWTSPLKSVDRLTPMGNAEHRQRPSPYEWHRRRCRHHKTEWLPSVFRGALPDKDFYDRPLTHRLNSIHLKEQCSNDGPFRSTSLRHTSFLSGLHRFSFFSVLQSIAATVGAATIYVFMGFHPGEPIQQGVPSTSGSVRVACLNLTCGGGIFFWLWHKKSPDTKWYLPAQAPANTSFCTRIFYVKARTSLFCRPTPFRCQATHTTTLSLDAWLKKKLPPI